LKNFKPMQPINGEVADLLPIIGETRNVLFVCSGNSVRSIMAEALLNHLGRRRFQAYSAGTASGETIHPVALEILESLGFSTMGLYSKSLHDYQHAKAPRIDIVVSVCPVDSANTLSAIPGNPVIMHWEIEDPAVVSGRAQRPAFLKTLRLLRRNIVQLIKAGAEN
jgi:arsenate reductase (thioredoxin)